MMATLHPAALLRNPSSKPGAFEDFLKLRGEDGRAWNFGGIGNLVRLAEEWIVKIKAIATD